MSYLFLCLLAWNNLASTGRILMKFIWGLLENLCFIKLWQEWRVLHEKTCVNLYLAKFFLEWEMFGTKVVETAKHVLFNNFFWKAWRLWDVEKYCTATQAPDDSTVQYSTEKMWFTCRITKTRIHTLIIFNTVCLQMNGAVSKVNKKFISHLTRAQCTPSAAATVQVSHALPAVRFSCLLRDHFPRCRRTKLTLPV